MRYAWLILLWVGFGITHSYLISDGFTRWIKKLLGSSYLFWRLLYNFISVATFFPMLSYTNHLDSVLFIDISPVVQRILLITASFILLWAFFTFDPLEFLGLRQLIQFFKGTSTPNRTENPPLPFRKGLYGIVRHPMYSATIVFMWSLDSTLSQIIMKVILTGYIVVGAMLEERKLVKEFGSSYVQYQKTVPMLIPFLK